MGIKKTLLSMIAGATALAGSILTPLESKATDDCLYVDATTSDFNIGSESAILRHRNPAVEGYDTRDGPWSGAPGSPYPVNIRAYTIPYGIELKTDSRAPTSETIYDITLKANGGQVTGTNKIWFSWGIPSADSNRIYTAKIWVDGKYTQSSNDISRIVDIRKTINENGGLVDLQENINVPDGTNFGNIKVSCRFLKDPEIKKFSCDETNVALETEVQSGSYTQDTIESKKNLADSTWNPEKTNNLEYIIPNALNFDGNETRNYNTSKGAELAKFYRIKRTESTE